MCRGDPETKSDQKVTAERVEIQTALKIRTFKALLKEDIPPNANGFSGRFVLAIRSTSDRAVKYKARDVIGRHRDKMRHMLILSASAIQVQTIRLLLTLSMLLNFDVRPSNAKQTYLWTAEPSDRQL